MVWLPVLEIVVLVEVPQLPPKEKVPVSLVVKV